MNVPFHEPVVYSHESTICHAWESGTNFSQTGRAFISFRRGHPKLTKKIGVNTIATLSFRRHKFHDPQPIIHFVPEAGSNVLKSVFLKKKISALSKHELYFGHFFDSLYFSFQKVMTASVFGTLLF